MSCEHCGPEWVHLSGCPYSNEVKLGTRDHWDAMSSYRDVGAMKWHCDAGCGYSTDYDISTMSSVMWCHRATCVPYLRKLLKRTMNQATVPAELQEEIAKTLEF